ncbi:MAG: ketopantoate reductase family protein [Acidimicrobiia bacterium]
MRRIVIVGAGAVGGVLAARLVESGADVVAVARGEHAAAIARDGLVLADPDREITVAVPVVERVAAVDLDPDDLVLLAVKSQDTAAVLADLVAVADPSTAVACFQNGVGNERAVGAAFPNVLGAVVMMPATHLEPGRVVANSAPVPGLFDVGRADGGVDAATRHLVAALAAAGFDARAVPDVMRWKHTKLLMSVGNAVDALCPRDRDAAALARRAKDEALAVYAAAGIGFASAAEEAERRGSLLTIRPVAGETRAGGSTWQSLARGLGAVEVEAFNGEIIRLGDAHGVATPVNRVLLERTLAAAAALELPGSVPAAELLGAADA